MNKTNVMRLLDSKKVSYQSITYDSSITDGETIARILNEDYTKVFKTLVTVGASKNHYVFVIPVHLSLDLKKAAKTANEKSLEMIKQKELLPLTGYIHGGCSPIGMKKAFETFIDISAKQFQTIFISGGKVGYQVQINPDDISKFVKISYNELTKPKEN